MDSVEGFGAYGVVCGLFGVMIRFHGVFGFYLLLLCEFCVDLIDMLHCKISIIL